MTRTAVPTLETQVRMAQTRSGRPRPRSEGHRSRSRWPGLRSGRLRLRSGRLRPRSGRPGPRPGPIADRPDRTNGRPGGKQPRGNRASRSPARPTSELGVGDLDLGSDPLAGGVDQRRGRFLGLGRLRERVLSEDGGPTEGLDSRFGSASGGLGDDRFDQLRDPLAILLRRKIPQQGKGTRFTTRYVVWCMPACRPCTFRGTPDPW